MIGLISLEDKKDASLLEWTIRRPHPPSQVQIPLRQGISVSTPCVSTGSRVQAGDKIAEPSDSKSVALHASISGTVTAIHHHPHPVYGNEQTIEISSTEDFASFPEFGAEKDAWQQWDGATLLEVFQEKGLVDLSPSMEPIHYTLTRDDNFKGKTLVFNACESEPYVTADQILMMSHAVEILKGAEMIRSAGEAARVIFVLDRNQEQAAEILRSKIYLLKWDHCEVRLLSQKYPQQNEKLLLGAIAKKEPEETRIFNYKVFNIATAFAAYEAVALGKPLIERIVTMGGECLVESKNLRLCIGTTFEDSIKACRGLLREPRKLLMGGPMQGVCQSDLSVPVLSGTQAILALPKEVAAPQDVQPCIRCGDCVSACPVQISPVMITLAAERDLFESAKEYGLESCIECGNCAYVCPSKRPMLELIRYAATYSAADDVSLRTPTVTTQADFASLPSS